MAPRPADLGAFADELARAALDGSPSSRAAGAEMLTALSGRDLLHLDDAARRHRTRSGAPISGLHGWLGASPSDPSGFVAAVTSMHVDGRVRERATSALGEVAGRWR